MGQSRLIVVRRDEPAVCCIEGWILDEAVARLCKRANSGRMEYSFEAFSERVSRLQEEIRQALDKYDRRADAVTLLPVTKTHPAEAALWAARVGLGSVGENRVQEAQGKKPEAAALAAGEGLPEPRWELIGHLQSNKAKTAVALFDRIQSVDSVKLLKLLDKYAGEAGKRMPVLLQINAGRDTAKFGADIDEAPFLLEAALECAHLRTEGLMTIAPLSEDPAVAERTFATLREIREGLQERYCVKLPVLSMGMSSDYEQAIKHGSTLIRVGTALFGAR